MLVYAVVALVLGVALDAYALWTLMRLPEAANYRSVAHARRDAGEAPSQEG